MGVAVLTILISVLGGTLLAFLPRKNAGWMGPMRTFGLAAAFSVVALHMVPESIEAIGGWVVPALGIGLALPAVLGGLGSLLWRAGRAAADPLSLKLEAGYAGLLVHKVGDGVALGVYAGDLHEKSGAHGFAAALAAHIVPVVAIVVLTFDSVRGRGSALVRAVGLAAAGLLGVFLARWVALGEVSAAQGWLSAVAAGMLLHVVAHDLGVDLPQSKLARALDVLVAGLGLSVSVLGGESHGAQHASAAQAVLGSLATWALAVGPPFLMGALVAAALVVFGRRERQEEPESPPSRALGLLLSAFAIETAFLCMGLLGVTFGLLYLTVAAVLALLVTLVRPRPSLATEAHTFLLVFDRRWLALGGWTLLALVLTALSEVVLHDRALAGLPAWSFQLGGWVLTGALGLACPPAAVPVAAVLMSAGWSPSVAFGSLLPGLALRLVQGRVRDPRALGTVLAAGAALGMAALLLPAESLTPLLGSRSLGFGRPLDVLPFVSGLVLLRSLYLVGFRGFLLPLEAGVAQVDQAGTGGRATHHGHSHGTPL